MRLARVAAMALTATLILPVTAASAKSVRARVAKPLVPPGQAKKEEPPPPPPKQEVNAAQCQSKRSVITDSENKLNEFRAELAGSEGEIRDLEVRLDELKKRRDWLKNWIGKVSTTVDQRRAQYRTECHSAETCDQYERLTDQLGQRRTPMEQYMQRISDEILQTRKDLVEIRRQINPLRAEYNNKQCNNMVAGETTQETINRCMAIFSEWNRLQSDLNRYNARLPALRGRYNEVAQQLSSVAQQASEYETYLAQNCAKSSKLQVVRTYQGVRDRAKAMQNDLDNLVRDVTELRGIQITIK